LIPSAHISEWQHTAPWPQRHQVEQDLVISRALIEIFSDPFLGENLAFRGGTALFKLHLQAVRYSEDIDLVQVTPGPIGDILDALRNKLDTWFPEEPGRKMGNTMTTLTYRFNSEDEALPMKFKIEINCREHFTVSGFHRKDFEVNSAWFSGRTSILTYGLNELLGTKVRALYQRRKGRDLFDLTQALGSDDNNHQEIIGCFLSYMDHEGHKVTRREFEKNLTAKFRDRSYREDIEPLLVEGTNWDFDKAASMVMDSLIALVP